MFAIDLTPSKEDKFLRRAITNKYGIITLAVSFTALAIITIRAFAIRRLPKLISKPFPLWLSVSLCALVLSLLSLVETHDDYLYLTKRLGRVAAASLPALYFLALRPSPIPLESYLRLLPIHIWLARIIVLLSTLHGILYINYWVRAGKFTTFFEPANLFGVLAVTSFLATVVVSIKYFRSRNHELFYKTHYVLAWACVPILAYHARPKIWWIAFYLSLFLVGQLIHRHFFGQYVRLGVRRISAHTQVVTLPRNIFPKYFSPGAHVRIGPTGLASRFWFIAASHPYTIASLASEEDCVRLIVKPGKRFQLEDGDQCIVYGPYGSATYADLVDMDQNSQSPQRIVVIAGGVGISFAAPIVTSLRRTNAKVTLLWATRTKEDLTLLKVLGLEGVNVFISPEGVDGIDDTFLPEEVGDTDVELRSTGQSKHGVESAPFDLASSYSSEVESLGDSTDSFKQRNIILNYKRMNIEEELRILKDETEPTIEPPSMSVISCGSRNLVIECTKWGQKIGANVFEEIYEI
ncbi:hypothetical protein V1525DRAFT_420613 [Lipomyces kononenkoae]|uniref:Uncharacterized protein n=1 Tax=Lipomyces kononenkoae TaxID=34357 RepID=A0ACC3SX02_LIPKO